MKTIPIEDIVDEFKRKSENWERLTSGFNALKIMQSNWLHKTLTSLVKDTKDEERENTITIVEDIKDFAGGVDSEIDSYINEILSNIRK
ncbi:MAG: hypothetical protein KJI69_05085 [Patescibacteria group bacterium]|nr:hypothetical protein [Patescibacteria group bacterium]